MPRDGKQGTEVQPDVTLPPSTHRGGASDATLPPGSGPALPAPATPAETLPPGPASTRSAPIVQALSAEEAQSAMTMAPPADASPSISFSPTSPTGISTGAFFGEYQVLETIAKGGMGIVFKARQRKLNRIVAIKMILAGQFADKTDVDRFYTEAEAAAALSHPNIVKIYEIGEVQGQHFFSMEYIEGQSLADLVRENPLTPKRAAEFAKTIAEAMQFAHEKGIVHRDLKPSNVLLDQQERPLITDFGLAKHQQNQSQITVAGALIGTPSYMPPEQAEGKGELMGPQSDLYSLGAILYELVTGRPPFRAASPMETIRQVIQDEPLSPRLVNPGVPKDLETICLKCLQKEPVRRYASSQELADELGRFLRGEPILARPISPAARFWRLCRRNPATSSAIALAVLALILTAVVSTWLSIETTRALAEADRSFREQMEAVEDLYTTVSDSTLLNQPGMQPVRKQILAKALNYYQRFLTQRGDDPRVQQELAAAVFRVGLITEALESPEKALPSYEKARQMQVAQLTEQPENPKRLEALGNTLNALGTVRVKQGKFELARNEYREAIHRRSQLVEVDRGNAEYQRVLANTHMNLGLAEFNAGNLEAARLHYDQSQQIRRQALANVSGGELEKKLRRDLGKCYFNRGLVESADCERVGEFGIHLAKLGEETAALANLQVADRYDAAAVEQFQLACDALEQAVGGDLADLENQSLLAAAYRLTGFQLQEQPDLARQWYRKALDRLSALALKNPDVKEYQAEQAGLYTSLAFLEPDNSDASLAAFEEAHRILRTLADRYPELPRYQQDLAAVLRELARGHFGKQQERARAELAEARGILEKLVKKYPKDERYADQLAVTTEDELLSPALPEDQ